MPTITLSSTPVAPALYPVSIPISASLSCRLTTDSAWRRWHSDLYPYAVRALVMEQGRLWAGTASGLFTVDPRTDQYTPTLPYETACGISVLLPLGDSRLWAEADRGHFYYDGHQWSQVQISGLTKNFRVTAEMIDQDGDLLVRHITGNLKARTRERAAIWIRQQYLI